MKKSESFKLSNRKHFFIVRDVANTATSKRRIYSVDGTE